MADRRPRGVLLAPAAASAESETVTSGQTTATLSWTPKGDGVTGAALTITRAGVEAFNEPIPEIVCDGCTLPGNGADDVKLVDLDGLGEPEVMVVAVKGCCPTAGIYSYNAGAGSYDQLLFLSIGFNVDDLDHDGRPEIVTQDWWLGLLMSDVHS